MSEVPHPDVGKSLGRCRSCAGVVQRAIRHSCWSTMAYSSLDALDTLESRPERCALAAEAEALGREIRELMFGKKLGRYRIFFQIHRQTVLILRIWHSARDEIRADDL